MIFNIWSILWFFVSRKQIVYKISSEYLQIINEIDIKMYMFEVHLPVHILRKNMSRCALTNVSTRLY